MAMGKIKRLIESKGYGFIQPAHGGEDVWFHLSVVKGDVRFEQLQVGMEVEYQFKKGTRGLLATSVQVIDGQTPAQPPRPTQPPYRFLNPYNFVRFILPSNGKSKAAPAATALGAAFKKAGGIQSDAESTKSKEDLLLGKCTPPPHDRYVGVTGKITCSLETFSPLFISSAEGIEQRQNHNAYEFFKIAGKPAIPGSSLRGMLRSVFEAVTNSCFSNLSDARLSYHLEPAKALKLVPARIEGNGNGTLELRLLPGFTELRPGKRPEGPQYAAWAPLYLSNMLRPSRNAQSNLPYGSRTDLALNGFEHKTQCWARLRLLEHPQRHFKFWNVEQLAKTEDQLDPLRDGERKAQGYLCITNQNIENKHDERFFFCGEGLERAKVIPLSDKAEKDYLILIRDYQDRHRDSVQRRRRDHKNPELPDGDDPAFSRFIVHENESKALQHGDLVYAMLNENREAEFIVPMSVPRVAYDNSIATLLPKLNVAKPLPKKPHDHSITEPSHSPLKACDHYEELCPACRVFGWVHQLEDKNKGDTGKRVAYAGRVQISHADLKHDKGTLPETPLAILSSPKPTTTSFYLADGEQQARADIDYDTSGALLRGRKFYRHHKRAVEENYFRAGGRCDDQNRTVRDALAPGAQFEFSIHFQNLAPLELGALLWALEMDRQCFHRLGFAKPLGFGSVKITVQDLQVLDPKQRYDSLEKNGWQPIPDWRARLVETFKTALANHHGFANFDAMPNVQDLRALLSESAEDLPIHYPRSSRQTDPEGKNFEWFMGNNRYVRQPLALATEDRGLPLIMRDGTELK